MKKISTILLIALALVLSGCTRSTDFGRCVGINDKDHSKEYEVSIWNIVMGVVFVETIVVPIVVVADDFYCPIGNKAK